MTPEINIPKAIYLYDEGTKDVDFQRLKRFIADNFGKIKVCLVRLKNRVVRTQGLSFDLVGTKRAIDQERKEFKEEKAACQIILTEKLLATLGQDRRLHLRASIYSYPSVISTSGIVEGPAKPREFYLYKEQYARLGIWDREEPRVKKKFKARFIDYHDKRLSEVLKGYVAQAIFFYIFGESFCPRKNCRLFNSHWQEELISAQIKSAKFCAAHQKILAKSKQACLSAGRED